MNVMGRTKDTNNDYDEDGAIGCMFVKCDEVGG